MLTSALTAAIAALALSTALLLIAGRRPTTRWLRVAWFAAVLLAPVIPVATTVTLVSIGLLGLVLPRHWYAIGAWFFGSLLVAAGLYAAYLVQATFVLGTDPVSLVLGAVLLVLEAAALVLLLLNAFEMIDALCAPSVDPVLPPDPERWPVVCLQVPCYNEPPELVTETVRSLVAIDYPALRIQVIDNNTPDAELWQPLEAECARLRADGNLVDFVHLPEWPGYKAGALNSGLANLSADVEVIGVVDADYVVEPDWLRATIPFFSDSKVAFVQTPQDYRDWERSSFYRACYVGFAYFYAVSMVSRARRDSIIFAGTMGLIRRAALDEVGGWDEAIITEDAEVSLRVLSRGYRPVYVPRAFGHGIMPLSYEGLRKQRFRWAFGGMQILRRHRGALLGRRSGLTLAQRFDYLNGGLGWFNDVLTLAFTVFAAAVAVATIAGRPFVIQRLSGVGLVLPIAFIALNLIRYLWGLRTTTGGSVALALAALRVTLSLSWVVALACVRGLTQERGVFLRTSKFSGAAAIREVRLVWVETALGAGAITLLVIVLLQAGFSQLGLVVAALLGWAALIYGSATSYALGDPTPAPLSDVLREKARLEIAPRVRGATRSRPARAGLALAAFAFVAVVAGLAGEAGRAPVRELPFAEVADGPLRELPAAVAQASPSPSPEPSPSSGPVATNGSASAPPGSASAGGPSTTSGPIAGPTAAPTRRPSPAPTPVPTVAPTSRPTPPVPVPTPAHTARPTPPRTPPPTPSRTPRPTP